MLHGYDIDGVLSLGVKPPEGQQYVVVSGRTFAEYDDFVKLLARNAPVYIRGSGAAGDRQSAGEFKATMINLLGITHFHEDDCVQLDIMRRRCVGCKFYLVKSAREIVAVEKE